LQIITKARLVGGSLVLTIPKHLAEYLDIEEDTQLLLEDEIGKKGKFAAFWNPNQKRK